MDYLAPTFNIHSGSTPVSCRCWCLTVGITWHPAICLPRASRSLITLVVVTYARQHVVILLFQPQGRSDTVLAALPWQDRPTGILFQHRYAAAILHQRSVVIWKQNGLPGRITSTLVTVSSGKSGRTYSVTFRLTIITITLRYLSLCKSLLVDTGCHRHQWLPRQHRTSRQTRHWTDCQWTCLRPNRHRAVELESVQTSVSSLSPST